MKICPMCKIKKPLNEFHKASNTKDGAQGHCKECKKILNKKYEKNRDAETRKKYYKNEWQKKKNNPNYIKQHKEWLDKNSDHVKKKAKEYRETNKTLLLISRSNQKSKKKGYSGVLSMKEWEFILNLTKFMCIACEENKADSIDHVLPLSNGGTNTVDNIQPMCLKCNLKKGARHVDFRSREFIEQIKKIGEQ